MKKKTNKRSRNITMTNNYIRHYFSTQDYCLYLLKFISMGKFISKEEMNNDIEKIFHGNFNKYQYGYLACKYSILLGHSPTQLGIKSELINHKKINEEVINEIKKIYNEDFSDLENEFDSKADLIDYKRIKQIVVENEKYGTYLLSIADYERYIK